MSQKQRPSPRPRLRPSPRRPPRPRPRTSPSPDSPRRPVAVAITGGIGAGKSELLHAFERHGAAVISSDEIVHALLRDDPDVKRTVVDLLGEEVLDEVGQIDRGAIARAVFTDHAKLRGLEELLHPLVIATYLRWREQLADLPEPPAVCVTEVPLLYEVGGEVRFDKVVAVTASLEKRVARSFHVTPGREKRLLSDKEKLQRADYSFVNDGTLEELEAFASDVMTKLSA